MDQSLVSDDKMIIPVQLNGKRRAEISVDRDISIEDLEKAVLELTVVKRVLKETPPKRVIIVPQRIVNVVF